MPPIHNDCAVIITETTSNIFSSLHKANWRLSEFGPSVLTTKCRASTAKHTSQMCNKDCEIKTATIYYLKTNFLHINFLHWEKHPFVLKITVTVTMYLQLPQFSTYRHLDDKYKNISVLFSNNNQNVYIFTFKWI